ncbi:hypothetical protein Taro_018749 [Colocasia esculenta]|uniref:Uncharacterized protein n=1 Tax=Colocasia esculenta TaxID=4460 RepID=A0A843UX76_COLES|nr:hypothetical protein [Colocasia esculenta]
MEEAERAEDRRPRALSPPPRRPRPHLAPSAEGEEYADRLLCALSPQPGLPHPLRPCVASPAEEEEQADRQPLTLSIPAAMAAHATASLLPLRQPASSSSSHRHRSTPSRTLQSLAPTPQTASPQWKEQSKQSFNDVMTDILEKVIAACEEKNLTNSLDPSILTQMLDDVYNGHHGGYERGRGLGCSRGVWRHNMSNEASNENAQGPLVRAGDASSECVVVSLTQTTGSIYRAGLLLSTSDQKDPSSPPSPCDGCNGCIMHAPRLNGALTVRPLNGHLSAKGANWRALFDVVGGHYVLLLHRYCL